MKIMNPYYDIKNVDDGPRNQYFRGAAIVVNWGLHSISNSLPLTYSFDFHSIRLIIINELMAQNFTLSTENVKI